MSVDILSVESYRNMGIAKDAQAQIIYETIRQATHPSSADLERLTGIQRTSVTGRLKELEESGRIRKADTKIDPFTKRRVNWYAVTEAYL